MSVVTDSKGLDDPKDPDTDNVFKLYQLLANKEQIESMRNNYITVSYTHLDYV